MNRFTPGDHAALIRRYFDACNAADYQGLVDCFTPDAVHYFPPGLPEIPWRSAETIARKWIWCVEHLGSIPEIRAPTDRPGSGSIAASRFRCRMAA